MSRRATTKRTSRCPCYRCQGYDTPGEADFCSCGYMFVHPALDKSKKRKCSNCGKAAP